ncbi:MAG: PP2C family protein-serine/threonine phosphatase [Cryomorphaceae bacterium]|nr:PP2C family protein-serine/threonine phosphatase [Flavobacteriales bacterium]
MTRNVQSERLQEKLKQRDYKLKALLEITNAINNNFSTTQLLEEFRDILENRLLIKRAVFFTKIGDEWLCPIQYGVEQDFSSIDVRSTFGDIRDMKWLTNNNEEEVYAGFDLLIPVFREERPLSYIIIGDLEDEALKMSPIIKHMRFIQTLANIISVAIENKFLFEQSLKQERVKTELALAAEMQALMVGSGTQNPDGFEVATFYKPHQEVGGDFCDFIPFSADEAFMCVADVSGKGVSAAFLMANVQAHLRALLEHTEWTLESIAIELNKKVIETVKGDRFVTMFMAYFHRPTRTLHYINAGHNPPVVWDRGQIHVLESGTVGIGMLDTLPFINKGEITLSPNASLVCYTDGVIEIENAHQDEYGYERLGELLLAKCPKLHHVQDLVGNIMDAVDEHRGDNAYFDDTALLCCRFK